MDPGIKGRRAIVTGGSSGIGYETARLFLEEYESSSQKESARTDQRARRRQARQGRDELAQKTGGAVHAVQADMTNDADIKHGGYGDGRIWMAGA